MQSSYLIAIGAMLLAVSVNLELFTSNTPGSLSPLFHHCLKSVHHVPPSTSHHPCFYIMSSSLTLDSAFL